MLDYTHFEALGHLFPLPLSSPQSSRSCRGRELPDYHRSSNSINSGSFLNLIYQNRFSFPKQFDRVLNLGPLAW
jgi:hypothetical protein